MSGLDLRNAAMYGNLQEGKRILEGNPNLLNDAVRAAGLPVPRPPAGLPVLPRPPARPWRRRPVAGSLRRGAPRAPPRPPPPRRVGRDHGRGAALAARSALALEGCGRGGGGSW